MSTRRRPISLLAAVALVAALVSVSGFGVAASASSPKHRPRSPAVTFAHPSMVGINGDGFELDLRPDPATPSTMYAGAPGASSANTSWIWKTTDAGRTWKWIPQALPLNGKVQGSTPHCLGGGDTEIMVDIHHHLYFNDLSGAVAVPLEFSTGRSDDGGTTFVCDTAGVGDIGVDRQWYAMIGDPTLNGGDQVDANTLYLTNDIIGTGAQGCGALGNVLVMYRSPIPAVAGVPTPNPDAGRTFGPHNVISCDEGIMGNDEVSPVATKRGEDGGLTLPTAVHHVFVSHDGSALNSILVARCFPVPFGPATKDASDPSGLRCVDKPVASLQGRTGANFPTLAIDRAGILYVMWEETFPGTRTLLRYAYSSDEAEHWSKPITLPVNAPARKLDGKQLGGPLNSNVFAWPVAGDDGRVDVAWYGSNATGDSPDKAEGYWSLWFTQSLNAHARSPVWSAPVLASEHFIHHGTMNTLIGGQGGDRALGDFLQVRMGPQGEAEISYADSNNATHSDTPHGMFVRQTGGASLLKKFGTVHLNGLRPNNRVTDIGGDGRYEAAGVVSDNIANLDLTASTVTRVPAGANDTAACPRSAGFSGCYRVRMDVANMSLSMPTSPDTDRDALWMTQWLVPSTQDEHGGKNLFVYAESFAGGNLQCFTGENSEYAQVFSITYPGTIPIANPASCAATMGPNGNVTITVPLNELIGVPGAIDTSLHEVISTTMTMVRSASLTTAGPFAELQPPADATGLFNEIDATPTYVFRP